ncbi:tripartite tricarboxylate transporter substrate binding protein [Reyranella aquatilis]|uniref:Tripartite tricarboxylate transporter substrate binding protein n=1 Tax=Reyranella aquatilis TaxID=2035356 RepID=A0ABS8L0G3_9HYPH|nr:tripartite tricarboxylate transporter substrate binding protein [Reyranella aquatilis]MCC8431792.1 tripartite tricarboxylate transporter substrate binding protein [Reyranella aquatilis]
MLVLPLAAAAAGGTPSARGQGFPLQPVHVVVPFPPGGGTDSLARAIQEPMQKALGGTGGGTMIVDNKGGGGGSIAHEFVAKQPADGHWLVVSANNLPLYPHIVAKLGFDARTAFVPIGFIAKQESILVGSLDAPWPDLKAIIAAAKASPGSVQYGTAGLTTPMHLSTEQFAMLNGIRLTHVPFRGTGPLVTDLLGGHIKLGMSSITSVAQQIAAGKLKPYAMASLERSSVAPFIPTFKELGAGDVDGTIVYTLLAPAGTPPAVVTRLNEALNAAVATPEQKQDLSRRGFVAMGGTPQQLGDWLKVQEPIWVPVLQAAGIKPE